MDFSSIGYAAALIAALVAVVQILLPNLLVLIMVGVLEDTHSAATWSVAGRFLGNSHWPIILRSDMATSLTVSPKVNFTVWLRPIALILVAVVAVVTPMGLHEEVQLSESPSLVTFTYQPDVGPFGMATLPRSNLGFSRWCGFATAFQCPGMNTRIEYSNDEDWFNTSVLDTYDRRIPELLASLYQSGLSRQPQSVSSFFDIEARSFREMKDQDDPENNQTFLIDVYRQFSTLIEASKITLVDGLIVDAVQGRVGFRNHSVPSSVPLPWGAIWDEDILFLEPETSCVETNVSLQYRYEDGVSISPGLRLVDNGGFVNSSRQNPWLLRNDMGFGDNMQMDPHLAERAYSAAWTANRLNMYYLNISQPGTNLSYVKSSVGQYFSVNESIGLPLVFGYEGMDAIGYLNGHDLIEVPQTSSIYNYSTTNVSVGPAGNPWRIGTENYTLIRYWCRGYTGREMPSMDLVAVNCGLMLALPTASDGSAIEVPVNGTWYDRKIFSCASTTRAVIRTVRFRHNDTITAGLDRLAVDSINPKAYQHPDALPHWGLEIANLSIANVDPLWGLINPDRAHSINLTTVQSDGFYIPASAGSVSQNSLTNGGYGTDYLPATLISKIWNTAYFGDSSSGIPDYTGKSRKIIAHLWRDMGYNAPGVAKIMNLVFTDLAASTFTGTRGWHTGNTPPPNLYKGSQPNNTRRQALNEINEPLPDEEVAQVPIYVYKRIIRYRWVYGIPAYMCLAMLVAIIITATLFVLRGRSNASQVRHYLWRLSAGRVLARLNFGPNAGSEDLATKVWIQQSGGKNITISGQGPTRHEYHILQQEDAKNQGSVEIRPDLPRLSDEMTRAPQNR